MNPMTDRPIHISFFLCDQMLVTSSTLPMEMLMAAESYLHARRRKPQVRLVIQTLSQSSDSLPRGPFGLRWENTLTIEDPAQHDLIYIPGLWRNPQPILARHQPTLDWLAQQHHNGSIISAVGTGCCFLAEAGLLNDKAATTHWHYFDQFQQRYPEIHLKRQHFITRAGNLYCAASINSLADLTVHFIQRFFGRAAASHVERHFSHEIRQSYESSVFFEDIHNRHPDEDIIQIQIWMQDNYHREIQIGDIAQRFSMSLRTLNRRFRSATGQSPVEYLQEIRINIARDLLKTSNLSLSEIADKVGYQDSSHFNHLFKKIVTVTPAAYRKTVRGKLFSSRKNESPSLQATGQDL